MNAVHGDGGDPEKKGLSGSVDRVDEAGLSGGDLQALIPVVEGAGGILTNWRGGPAHEGGQVVAAATRELHAAALAKLSTWLTEVALAIEMGADAVDLGHTIHPHPTLSETVNFAAEMFEGTITDLMPPKKKKKH